MEMLADRGKIADRFDESSRGVTGMRAGEADALHARHAVHRFEQCCEIAGRIVRRLVVVDDLSQEVNLPSALVNRLPDVVHDLRLLSHPLVAPGVRDNAEGAEIVAAFDDRDVGLDRVFVARESERERRFIVGRRDVHERAQIDVPSRRVAAGRAPA